MNPARMSVPVLLYLSLSGCALFSKGEVAVRRYYSPELEGPALAATHESSTLELRLGRVTSGVSLDERMMVRDSAQEIGFYDDRLWTETPETYLRRGLSRVLFEERGLRSVLRGAAPTLDVELISFEEVVAPAHLGRVKLRFSVSDERLVSLQQTLTIDRPVVVRSPEREGSAVARALGLALHEAITQLATQVTAELAQGQSSERSCCRQGDPPCR